GCAGPDCVAQCDAALSAAPACNDVAQVLLDCLAVEAPKTSSCIVEACIPVREKLEVCVSQASCAQPVLGGGDPGTCVGKGICGVTERAAQCAASGACTCELQSGPEIAG